MALTPQKQHAVDELVRKSIGPKQAVVKCVGRRLTSKKHCNFQLFLLDSGKTAFVNLDADPMTCHVSDKPNAAHFGRYKRQQERAERILAKKAAKEAAAKKVGN